MEVNGAQISRATGLWQNVLGAVSHDIPLPWLFYSAILIAGFSGVVVGGSTLLAHSNTVTLEGPYGYDGHRPASLHVIDPGGSAWVDEPLAEVVSKEILAGRLPLWNPYSGAGTPLAAELISEAFSPLRFPLFLHPSAAMWDAFLLFRLLLAAVLMYYFCRRIHLDKAPSLVGGALYGLSGYFVYYANLFHLDVEVAVPAVFLGIELVLARPRSLPRMAFLGAGLALLILGGNPEPTFIAGLTAGAYALVRALLQSGATSEQKARALGALTGSAVIGLLLSLYLLLPFAELFRRAANFHGTDVGQNVNPLSGFLSLFAPEFFGRLHQHWNGLSGHQFIPYLGTSVLLLAPLSLGKLKGDQSTIRWFFIGTAAFFIMKVYGLNLLQVGRFGVPGSIGDLPIFNQMLWIKYTGLLTFAIAVLAALGFQRALRREWRLDRLYLALGVVALPTSVVATVIFYREYLDNPEVADFVLKSTAISGVVLLSLAVIFGLWYSKRLRQSAFLLLIPALLGAELAWYVPKDRWERYDNFSEAPYVRFLLDQRDISQPFRIYGVGRTFMPQTSSVFGISDLRNLDALIVDNYYTYMRSLVTGDVTNDYPFFTGSAYTDPILENPFLDLMNVRFILSTEDLAVAHFFNGLTKTATTSAAGAPTATQFTINGNTKHVLYEHPPQTIRYPITVPSSGAALSFSLGLSPDVWSPSKGDGVTFSVAIAEGEGVTEVFSQYIDPKSRPQERRWHDAQVDLTPWAGEPITLVLQTDSGPQGDSSWDWGGWGNLRLVSPSEGTEVVGKYRLVYGGEVKIYENPDAFPRGFLVTNALEVRSGDDPLPIMTSPDFDPASTAVVHGELPSRIKAALGKAPDDDSAFTITSYEPDEVKGVARTGQPALLVLSDTYYPGWNAYVDGKRVDVYRVNLTMRGVFLDEGKHEVRFAYEPRSARWGLLISGVTALTLSGMIVWQLIRERLWRRRRGACHR